jgi:hypothetical protein
MVALITKMFAIFKFFLGGLWWQFFTLSWLIIWFYELWNIMVVNIWWISLCKCQNPTQNCLEKTNSLKMALFKSLSSSPIA